MKAVLLAAGTGSRMRPLSETRPKPMLPVGDRPMLAHVADAAVDAGADGLVIVDRQADAIRSYFGAEYSGVTVQYADQGRADGTAGAVAAATEYLDGDFAVLNGDNRYDAASIDTLLSSGPAVGVHRVANPTNYGVVSVQDDRVTDIVEKPDDPPTQYANTGAYVFPAEAREWVDVPPSERGERELTDVLARTLETTDVSAVEVDTWQDCGRPWELLGANETFLQRLDRDSAGAVDESAVIEGDVVVEAGATVRPGTVIEGPALIRAGATVGPNAYVRGATLVGRDATVGHGSEVKNSVLMEGASVPHRSYVGDSVLGRDVNLGAGTTVANVRHDDAPVRVTVKGDRVSTGRRKFGVILGDGVQTGIQTSLAPGVVLDVGTTTRPGEVVMQDRWQHNPATNRIETHRKPS